MSLPHNWMLYDQAIDERCQDLIDYKIWDGITIDQYKLWRRNFRTDEERFLAACMLDALIYRSKSQTLAMLEDNLYRNIKNTFRIHQPATGLITSFPECLKERRKDPQIRIVLTVREKDDPVKGVYIISRMIKRDFGINSKYIIKPTDIDKAFKEENVRTFIFIDDISGTGSSFCEVYDECDITQLKQSYVMFAPLAIHETALNKIRSHDSDVKICFAEKLDSSNSFLNFKLGTDINDEINKIYSKLVKSKMSKVPSRMVNGYGALGLLYLFEHACPNNSLPVLYHEGNSWQPLFVR